MNTLELLARAQKDGKPVHDLWTQCPHCEGRKQYIDMNSRTPSMMDCIRCQGRGSIPNPDPMALIVACQNRWDFKPIWRPHYTSHHVKLYDWAGTLVRTGNGPTFETALANAVLQATVPLSVNLEKCGGEVDVDETAESNGCQGWGYLTGRNKAIGCLKCGGSGDDDSGTMILGTGVVLQT